MKCIIVHGFNADGKELWEKGKPLQNERDWIPWLRDSLEEKDIEAHNPSMPKFWSPNYEEWKEKFEEDFEIDEETVLVGHSLGAGFLLRYLSENKPKIKRLILVAPAVIVGDKFPSLNEFYNFEIDKSLKDRAEEIVVFTSDNDSQRMIDSANMIHEKLDARVKEFKNYGHFVEKHMETKEFPELLNEVIS